MLEVGVFNSLYTGVHIDWWDLEEVPYFLPRLSCLSSMILVEQLISGITGKSIHTT